MPYNTRRKSLSLPLLGIQLPSGSRAAHRSPPATASSPTSVISTPPEHPPSKKVKRSHTSNLTSPQRSRSLRTSFIRILDDRMKNNGRMAEQTPPPSPGIEAEAARIDTNGIDDDIVIGVIRQLEKTGNRPHLLKELATVLANSIPLIENSANPSAIISSRLSAYLRRPWTALSPSPLAKKLVGTHPRRMYFFLTTIPNQPFPEYIETPAMSPSISNDAPKPATRIITPSASSATDYDDEDDENCERGTRFRNALSPSPEIDLSSPFLDDIVSLPLGAVPNPTHLSQNHDSNTGVQQNKSVQSPNIEREEHDFTQNPNLLESMHRSWSLASACASESSFLSVPSLISPGGSKRESLSISDLRAEEWNDTDVVMGGQNEMKCGDEDETEESVATKNSLIAARLFCGVKEADNGRTVFARRSQGRRKSLTDIIMYDANDDADTIVNPHGLVEWGWEWKNDESVELEELDDLFGGY